MKRKAGFPFYHLNGTSPQTHSELIERAYGKLVEAYSAMAELAPNMRDYYPLPGAREEFDLALQNHERRMNALKGLMVELEELAEYAALSMQRGGTPYEG